MADFDKVPNTVLYDWCNYTSTLLSIEPPAAQWSGSSVVRFDSQLELRIFSEHSGVRFLHLPNYTISVLTWYFSGDSNLLTSEG